MIPLVDLKAQYRSIKEEMDSAIQGVLERTQFINGPEVSEFEKNFAEYCGAKHAVGVGNGTDALILALDALGVGSGDEVITTANTFIATAEAISAVGATPVFIDVDPRHFNMTGSGFEEAITPRTKSVIPVHLYGQPAPMNEISEVANRHNIKIIEDSAQAHGASYTGNPVGTWGDVTCFSFYPAKNLGAYGDAGAVITNDSDLATAIRMRKDHGRTQKYTHDFIGTNSRLDTMQAAILNVKLGHLTEWTDRRRAIADAYTAALSEFDWIGLPEAMEDARHVYHLYVIQVDQRDALQKHLADSGVGTGVHYPIALNLQPAYSHLGYKQGDFPVSESLGDRILSLPMYPELTDEQIQQVVGAIATFSGNS
ncbi:MAG: DegT/DnrJ/EryC1/StrS family aminotransferase [SAR202 cluster bacterium]|nr:DegT/DnrJ/EryC1/StrS family aminotransferase [SAR202 cluster bacterium]